MTSHSGHSFKYWIGVSLVLYAGLAAALANVVQVILIKEKSNITTSHHVIIGGRMKILTIFLSFRMIHSPGIWSVFISLVTIPLSPNRLVTAPLSLSPLSWAMLFLTGSLTLLAFWWLVLSVSLLRAPTLVQMLRSTEICLTLVTEAVVTASAPAPSSALGSLLVMACVGLMAAHDNIIKTLKRLRSHAETEAAV